MGNNAIITPEGLVSYEHALGLLDTSFRKLRHIAHNLIPESLFKFGLRQATEDFCGIVGSIGIKVNFAFYGVERRFDEKLEIASYKIIQELVNNAAKHSEASEISVQLICENDRLSMTVQDNGIGMEKDIEESTSGKGLSNIRSKVASFNGHFDISSEHGKGTEAIVEFKV
jgi:two-component system, NarL family, sensor kinase